MVLGLKYLHVGLYLFKPKDNQEREQDGEKSDFDIFDHVYSSFCGLYHRDIEFPCGNECHDNNDTDNGSRHKLVLHSLPPPLCGVIE